MELIFSFICRYQVLTLDIQRDQIAEIRKIVDEFQLDEWAVGKDWMDVMVSLENSRIVKERLMRHGVKYQTKIENVQE